MNIGLIVEGHGDVIAMPALVRRVAAELGYVDYVNIPRPFRLPRGQFVRHELNRAVELVSRQVGNGGVVLVILDADDDCPVDLKETIEANLAPMKHVNAIVVVANREAEAWFIACAESLRGIRGLADTAECPADPDLPRDAKGWLGSRMPAKYSETLDQPAFAANVDVEKAVRSRSFRKLAKVMCDVLGLPRPVGVY